METGTVTGSTASQTTRSSFILIHFWACLGLFQLSFFKTNLLLRRPVWRWINLSHLLPRSPLFRSIDIACAGLGLTFKQHSLGMMYPAHLEEVLGWPENSISLAGGDSRDRGGWDVDIRVTWFLPSSTRSFYWDLRALHQVHLCPATWAPTLPACAAAPTATGRTAENIETARYMWIDSKTWATFPSCSDLDQDLPPGWLWFTKSKSKHVPASLILAKFRCVSAKEWSVQVLKKGDIYVAYYSSWMNQSRVWAHLQL